jgi:hypothetical protein
MEPGEDGYADAAITPHTVHAVLVTPSREAYPLGNGMSVGWVVRPLNERKGGPPCAHAKAEHDLFMPYHDPTCRPEVKSDA